MHSATRFVCKLALLLALLPALASAQTKISALPSASPILGPEPIPAVQSGATVQTTPAALNTYIQAHPAAIGAGTVLANITGSSAAPTGTGPYVICNAIGCIIVVDAATQSNSTLSGTQTVDGVTLQAGQTVLATSQSTLAQNGFYTYNPSGAWPRVTWMPAGFVIPQNCDILVFVLYGNTSSGLPYRIPTTSGAITVGTTAMTVTAPNVFAVATSTRLGVVKSSTPGGAALIDATFTTPSTDDCASWLVSGDIGNPGDASGVHGICAVENLSNGHLVLQNGGFVPTASVGTINANSTDHWGIVTGLSGATAITITFAGAYSQLPACAQPSFHATSGSVPATVDTNESTTAVVFTFSAAFTGTFKYSGCFGTN